MQGALEQAGEEGGPKPCLVLGEGVLDFDGGALPEALVPAQGLLGDQVHRADLVEAQPLEASAQGRRGLDDGRLRKGGGPGGGGRVRDGVVALVAGDFFGEVLAQGEVLAPGGGVEQPAAGALLELRGGRGEDPADLFSGGARTQDGVDLRGRDLDGLRGLLARIGVHGRAGLAAADLEDELRGPCARQGRGLGVGPTLEAVGGFRAQAEALGGGADGAGGEVGAL